jgi:hypothetical protein
MVMFFLEHLCLLFSINFCRKFEDIFDVDHFIDYLKNDVRIVRDIPDWFTDKSELFTSIRFGGFLCFWFRAINKYKNPEVNKAHVLPLQDL